MFDVVHGFITNELKQKLLSKSECIKVLDKMSNDAFRNKLSRNHVPVAVFPFQARTASRNTKNTSFFIAGCNSRPRWSFKNIKIIENYVPFTSFRGAWSTEAQTVGQFNIHSCLEDFFVPRDLHYTYQNHNP